MIAIALKIQELIAKTHPEHVPVQYEDGEHAFAKIAHVIEDLQKQNAELKAVVDRADDIYTSNAVALIRGKYPYFDKRLEDYALARDKFRKEEHE